GPGQVVVDVELAGITFVETQVRAGRAPNPAMAPALPGILGNGVGGVMAAVGPGLHPALAGTRLVTSTGGSGGYAERVAVVAAARGARSLEVAGRMGAEAEVDYSVPGWGALVGPAEVALDGVGGGVGRAAFELVRPGGRFSAFGLASGAFAQVSDEQAEQRR